MSLIIALKTAEGLVIGADSIILKSDESKEVVECEGNNKIWAVPHPYEKTVKVDGPAYLMGGVGTYRDIMTVRYEFEYSGNLSMSEIHKTIIPNIINILINHGYMKEEKPYDQMDSSFILADINHIYLIGSDFSVVEKKQVATLGFYADQAFALMKQALDGKDPEKDLNNQEAIDLIVKVFKICTINCVNVSDPFYFRVLTKKE